MGEGNQYTEGAQPAHLIFVGPGSCILTTSYFDEMALFLALKVAENLSFLLLSQFAGIFLPECICSSSYRVYKGSELWMLIMKEELCLGILLIHSSLIPQVFVECLLCVRRSGP